jgi:hypothetical protein
MPRVLLSHHLKQLKLTTVLREYDKVAHECARASVDHPRYLLRLVERTIRAWLSGASIRRHKSRFRTMSNLVA